ncbi:FAD binding domain-containing protein [Planomonospora venezuelensis]|uniref:CO/xanthine dehydrogenase FAD-binding subunit n=1 Tax=Planomonospora venezuelensis TaxID=1999 RepID=A0A841CWY3_PLAVE|nr:xanthine dehydrogenase family protein subunit M [Planomonospora venezuelensis]MBB5961819.1 CO/xanthine dehydrogenase FAD-binding subunit [Planomonospora venezuelensis]GIM99117.1 carbon-monoxide dehydrogenase medium subunit [Planomonospora venezuelensis]
MDFLQPTTWAEALAAKADRPEAVPVQGGTDVMVELNFDLHRPAALLDLNRVAELAEWSSEPDGRLRVGAGVPYVRLIAELGGRLPGLAQAARTVGSPQIRNRGTVGGNLGAASPAGDSHPPLLAGDAVIEVESAARGVRTIPAAEFYLGVKRSALEPDELIRAFRMSPATGPQYFSKVGTRNAMVIAVCSFAIALHPGERRVGTGIGSAAPTPRRARAAEEFLAAELDWDARLDPAVLARFGELAAQAASPIDDVRGTADYRRHAIGVMARRTLTWAWNEFRSGHFERRAG